MPCTCADRSLARPAPYQLCLKPPDGELQGGEHLVEGSFPLGVEHPCREHPAIHPPRGQQLEQLARYIGRAAGGVHVTMDREEKSGAWDNGEKDRDEKY